MMLMSPVEKIDHTYIKPLPNRKKVKAVAVCRSHRNIIVLSDKGELYASYAPKCAYTLACNLDDIVLAMQTVGYITPAQAQEHIEASAAARQKRKNRDNAKHFARQADELGIKLTAAQRKKLGLETESKPT